MTSVYPHLIQAVLSDWCGTIEANVSPRLQAITKACSALGITLPTHDQLQSISGMSAAETVQLIFRGSTHSDAEKKQFHDKVKQYLLSDDLSLIIQPETLSWLTKNTKLCLITNALDDYVEHNLKKYDMLNTFVHIATASHYLPKPDPSMLSGLRAKLDIPAASCLVVGDHPNDLLAANRAQMPCVIVETGVATPDYFASIQPQPIASCTDINALPSLIEKINTGQPI